MDALDLQQVYGLVVASEALRPYQRRRLFKQAAKVLRAQKQQEADARQQRSGLGAHKGWGQTQVSEGARGEEAQGPHVHAGGCLFQSSWHLPQGLHAYDRHGQAACSPSTLHMQFACYSLQACTHPGERNTGECSPGWVRACLSEVQADIVGYSQGW
eukprot:scaffold45559_cov23-Tisochrysis_lutea.AAC.1